MKVMSVKMLREFWKNHADAEQPLKSWYEEANKASWGSPADVKARFPKASIIANNRIVFNIKGNAYRLIVSVAYRTQTMYIKFIDTHAIYDTIDATTVDRS